MRLHIIAILVVALVGIFSTAQADGIKDRMLQRLPVLNELKAQGLIGENNLGFLEYRTATKAEAETVAAENADRKTVYQAIAKRQNTTVELVGQARAKQIASKEAPGSWIQDDTGAWKRK